MKKIALNITLFLICLIGTLFIYINILNEILYRFINLGTTLYLSLVLFSAYSLFIIINLIIYKKINKTLLDILAIMYFIVILGLTFNKGSYGGINLNPFTLINDFKEYFWHTSLLLITNIIIYFPLGLYFKFRINIKSLMLILYFLIYIVLIEFTQYFLHRGVLDINDIITNLLGFTIGVYLYPLKLNKLNKLKYKPIIYE